VSTTHIIWAWGTNTHIAFNPATDILDFGWFAAGQFTISEVNGTVVIAIPSNHQTYTLDNTTLSELHLSNVVGKDPTAISEWTTALGSSTTTPAPVTPPVVTPPVTPPVVTPPPVTPPPTGASDWSSNAVYTAGMTATENGVTYKANWWVQGVDPAQHSGVGDSGEAWTIIAGGSHDPTPWLATKVYTAGLEVIENGVTYQANWWTQGSDPAHNNGANGTGEPWTVVSGSEPTHTVPLAPTGLTATGTSASVTDLSWNTASVPDHSPVTGYAIFENNHQIATTTGTSYEVTNLAADTSYQFTVTAIDAGGSSPQASPISVHTAAAPSSGSGGGGSGGGTGGGANPAHEFSPYIDMAMSQDADLMAISHASGIENFTLAFMLASDKGIGWQGAGSITDDTLVNGTTILHQVQAVQAAGGHITISFGGAAGQEAALTAPNAATLQAEYQSVIDRYHVNSIDFDIEGAAVENQHSITLRDQALVGLEKANPNLQVSFTLPVLPTGLVASGLNVLQSAKNDGVKINTVNIMTMDYGASVDNNGQMGQDAISAIIATEKQLSNLGVNAQIGVTPMIGVNDIASEVFKLSDAQALLNYAQTDPKVAELSMWSVARDNGNSAGAHYASSDSSGIAQHAYDFSAIFHQFDLHA
jgi:chitodextrinase/chitinase